MHKNFKLPTGTPDISWLPANFAVSKLIENHPKSWLPESLRFDQKVTSEFDAIFPYFLQKRVHILRGNMESRKPQTLMVTTVP